MKRERSLGLIIKAVICAGLLIGFSIPSAFAGGMEKDESRTRTRLNYNKSAKSTPMSSKKKKTNAHALSDFELAKYQYCGDDSECVIAINGCCDCVNGGQEVAVNKNRLNAFNSRFSCLNVSCGTQDADPHCANGVVSCISHRCHYIDDRSY